MEGDAPAEPFVDNGTKTMGMHFGLIAARATSTQLRDAFLQSFPEYQVIDAKEFSDAAAMESWSESQKEFVSAANWSKERPGKTSFMFWQDGPWAAMWDDGYVHSADEQKMADLSTRLGVVLAFVVESTSGCAFFACYDGGRQIRMINNGDGEMTTEGNALREEAGVNIEQYYMDETEALMKAFGLSPLEQMPVSNGCLALIAIDRTDYSQLQTTPNREAAEPPAASTSKSNPSEKPWWKFW